MTFLSNDECIEASNEKCYEDQDEDEESKNVRSLNNGEPVQTSLLEREVMVLYLSITEETLRVKDQEFFTINCRE